MKNIKILSAVFLLICAATSCKKEDLNSYVIQDVTYNFSDINNCNMNDGGSNGSSLTLQLQVDNPNYDDIYGLKIIFKQKKKKDDVQILTRELDLSFNNDRINTYRCIRFGNLDKGTYVISIMTMDGLESEPYTLDVSRPSGAN